MRTQSVLTLFTFELLTPAAAQTLAPASSEIRTSASASVPIVANLATVPIQFSARARTPRAAGRLAAQRANAIRQALIAVGIPQDSMPTGGWYWGARSTMVVGPSMYDTSFVTTDVFTARVRNLALLGRVIDTALVQGASNIGDIQFTATETEHAHAAALRQATHQARENAEIMAEASGGKLDRLLEMTTDQPSWYGNREFSLQEVVASGTAGSSANTTIVVPQLRLTVSVHARWSFQPKP